MIEADCEYDRVIVTMSRDEAAAILEHTRRPLVMLALHAALRNAIDDTPYEPVMVTP